MCELQAGGAEVPEGGAELIRPPGLALPSFCLPGLTPPSWTFLTSCIMKGSCRPVRTLWTESAFAAGRVCLDR